MIPAYASHSLGIGCIVLNSRGELLVIQEKFAHPMLPDFWKLVRAQAHVALSGDGGPALHCTQRSAAESTARGSFFHSRLV